GRVEPPARLLLRRARVTAGGQSKEARQQCVEREQRGLGSRTGSSEAARAPSREESHQRGGREDGEQQTGGAAPLRREWEGPGGRPCGKIEDAEAARPLVELSLAVPAEVRRRERLAAGRVVLRRDESVDVVHRDVEPDAVRTETRESGEVR